MLITSVRVGQGQTGIDNDVGRIGLMGTSKHDKCPLLVSSMNEDEHFENANISSATHALIHTYIIHVHVSLRVWAGQNDGLWWGCCR